MSRKSQVIPGMKNKREFGKYDTIADDLIYDVRPEVRGYRDDAPADSRPTDADDVEVTRPASLALSYCSSPG